VQKKPDPRHNLARSLKLLLEKTRMSPVDLAKKAGIDRKTVNNQLNGKYLPRHDIVDAEAAVFGFAGWQLLDPAFHPDKTRPVDTEKLGSLVEASRDLSDQQVEILISVARGMTRP
jgi:DNA-binding XRE family transcriptional regulator